MKINLHLHTVYSDGVLTPAEIVAMQKSEGIEALSITDHDSIFGVNEGIAEGEKLGVKVLPGIEISSYSQFEIHILGYNFDYQNPAFVQKLGEISELRRTRIKKTIELLQQYGVDLDTTELKDCDGNIGRMHVAKQMVKQGYSLSVSDAFYHYLGAGKQAHVEGCRLRPFEAVKLIKEFNGLAVLAHPVLIPREKLELLITGLKDYGLDGLECYYASHNESETKYFLSLAKRYRMITTCGTDYHDENSYISPDFQNDKVDNYSLSKLKLI